LGQTQASNVDRESENSAAPVKSGAGGDVQKKPVVRLLNKVRKSDIETCGAHALPQHYNLLREVASDIELT